jgi:hypothetical protein
MNALASLLLLLAQDAVPFDPAVHEATKSFSFDEHRIVPVRVHLLRCKDEDALNGRLKADDVRRIFGKANRIWNKAGLVLDLESIMEEEVPRPEGFDPANAATCKLARPEGSRPEGMIHVYYVHLLPMNGIYMGADAIFVKDTAALRPAKGGVDEPIPRVTSHEIGHAFGLPHRQDTINLMASGTTGWSVNDAEIDAVRAWAARRPWILTPAAAFEKGRYEAVAAVPAEGALRDEARRRLPPR